jgi:hypothetical protein
MLYEIVFSFVVTDVLCVCVCDSDMQSRLLQQKDQIDEQEELIATKEAELLKVC